MNKEQLMEILETVEPNLPSWKKVNSFSCSRNGIYCELEFESIDNQNDSLVARLFSLECGNYYADVKVKISPQGSNEDGLMFHDYQFDSATCSEPPIAQIVIFVDAIMAFATQFRAKSEVSS